MTRLVFTGISFTLAVAAANPVLLSSLRDLKSKTSVNETTDPSAFVWSGIWPYVTWPV